MKKIKILFLTVLIVLSSCKSENSAFENMDLSAYPDFFTYEISDYTGGYSVSEDGTLYVATYSHSEQGYVENEKLCAYDMNGNCIEEFNIQTPMIFTVSEDILYGCFSENNTYLLYSLNLSTAEKTVICDMSEFSNIKRIVKSENTVYILGESNERKGISGEFSDDFGVYNYNGEKLISVDITTGKITESSVPFPIAFSVFDGKCTVYGADMDGYYFSGFDNKDKHYHNIEQLYNFELYEPDCYIFSSGSGINIGMLSTGSVIADDGIAQMNEDCYTMDTIIVKNGFSYVKTLGTDTENQKICRLKNSAYIKKNNRINFIASEYSFDAPFGCGYTINYEAMDADSFALSVLSQDSNYDMCIVNSFENFSSNIRDKGSFYSLNDIPDVTEYLDKCFPYIKEAATDENGDIWMLPVKIDIPVIVYNKEACDEMGIDFSRKPTVQEYVEISENAYNSEYKDGFATHTYVFIQNLLIQYMANHTAFDTAEFKAFAEFSKEKINVSDYTTYPAYFPPVGNAWNYLYEEGTEKSCLFSYERSGNEAVWYTSFDCFEFAGTPSIDMNDKANATCAFLTVNPSSGNLEATLDYISSLAEYLSRQENSFMLSDKAAYTVPDSLYNLYANAQIGFNVSEEICYDSFVKYHRGELSLEEMTAECDRKLSAYMNE